ncbi:hypothetical protein F5J12DRAFT_727576, partial [Pisolithus orientalis]|uniref:uncharacterized protein n=1 Tax=Pisolithus orientalis TaxID=936130 RepID=UPI002224E494
FQDAYYVHEFRGWKGATVHDPLDAQDQDLALQKFIDVLHMERIDPDSWYIDHATGHETVLNHCLPSLDQEVINPIVIKSPFHVDHMMHLKELAGFQYAPGRKGHDDEVHYIQAYATEKTMSYQLHPGLFTPLDLMSLFITDNLETLIKKTEEMSKILFNCTGGEAGHAQEGCARLKCMYYHKWLDLIALLGVQSCNRVQAAIRQKFSTLVWIPFTGSDRIWCTGPMTGRGWFTLPEGHPPAGPQIALNLHLNVRHLGLGNLSCGSCPLQTMQMISWMVRMRMVMCCQLHPGLPYSMRMREMIGYLYCEEH